MKLLLSMTLLILIGFGCTDGKSNNLVNTTSSSKKLQNNTRLIYGDSGFPKNCRAIIKENIDDWNALKTGQHDIQEILSVATGALDSIDRNCGEFGYSWDRI
jgi:hypothetical protein